MAGKGTPFEERRSLPRASSLVKPFCFFIQLQRFWMKKQKDRVPVLECGNSFAAFSLSQARGLGVN